MKEIKKIEFYNTPPEQAEEAKKEIQKVERAEKRKTKAVPQPKNREGVLLSLVIIGALIILIQNTIPFFRAIKYTMTNNKNIQFSKEKPDLISAMREYREERIVEVDAKILDAFGAPTPTITPTPTIFYPTP